MRLSLRATVDGKPATVLMTREQALELAEELIPFLRKSVRTGWCDITHDCSRRPGHRGVCIPAPTVTR